MHLGAEGQLLLLLESTILPARCERIEAQQQRLDHMLPSAVDCRRLAAERHLHERHAFFGRLEA